MTTSTPAAPALRSETSHVERIDRDGFVRVVHGEITSGGHQLSIHLAGRDDISPAHRTYPTGYDSRCGWCWLGANHSEDAHRIGVAR